MHSTTHVLKLKLNFSTGMPLKSVEATGDIVEPQQTNKEFSSYMNPWDDPYSDFSKYFSAHADGTINSDVDLASVSAAVRLVSFRNLDDWCYVEEFDRNTFTQVHFSTSSLSIYSTVSFYSIKPSAFLENSVELIEL